MSERGVLAVYKYLDDLTDAISEIRGKSEFHGYEIFSPTSYHEIEHAAGYETSPVKWFTLAGGMTGTITGFGLALACDYDWPLVVGGKTAGVYSLPSYVIMGFELTILFGAIMTITGMLVMGRLPNPKARVYDVRTTDDHFAIFVPNVDLNSSQAATLKKHGAIEMKAIAEA